MLALGSALCGPTSSAINQRDGAEQGQHRPAPLCARDLLPTRLLYLASEPHLTSEGLHN